MTRLFELQKANTRLGKHSRAGLNSHLISGRAKFTIEAVYAKHKNAELSSRPGPPRASTVSHGRNGMRGLHVRVQKESKLQAPQEEDPDPAFMEKLHSADPALLEAALESQYIDPNFMHFNG